MEARPPFAKVVVSLWGGGGLPEYVDSTERAPCKEVVARSGLRRGWEGRVENIFAEMSLSHRRAGFASLATD